MKPQNYEDKEMKMADEGYVGRVDIMEETQSK